MTWLGLEVFTALASEGTVALPLGLPGGGQLGPWVLGGEVGGGPVVGVVVDGTVVVVVGRVVVVVDGDVVVEEGKVPPVDVGPLNPVVLVGSVVEDDVAEGAEVTVASVVVVRSAAASICSDGTFSEVAT